MVIDYIYNEIFRKIRIELGYTQQEFAVALNCTEQQVFLIENNEKYVTNETLQNLSNIYNMDIRNNLYTLANFRSFEIYDKYKKLLVYQDVDSYKYLVHLEEELSDQIIEEEFINGDLLLLKNLSYAILQCFLYENDDKAIEFCLQNLECSEEELYTYSLKTMKSSFFYSTLTILIISAFKSGKSDLALAVGRNLLAHYETVWNKDVFMLETTEDLYKTQHILFYIMYGFMLFKSGEYEQALELCERTLAKCKELDVLNMLEATLFIKIQVLQEMGDIEKAELVTKDLKAFAKYSEIPTQILEFAGFKVEDFIELFAQ